MSTTTTTTTTTPPSNNAPHNVQTVLNYYKDPEDGSPPAPAIAGKPETYFRPAETVPVTITDISGREHEYTLDSHGFQYHYHESREKEFVDEEVIKKVYYPEVEGLVKEVTGASKIYIFDHTIRRPPPPFPESSSSLRTPVKRVHIDQSYSASRNRVLHHLPTESDLLLKSRYQIINIWRPINNPVYKDPLAVADAHSVPDSDLVPVKLIYPDREGETYSVRANKNHKWYFRYGQTPEMVLFIKCFDSKTDGRARRVPHSAFVDPEFDRDEVRGRESIEVRALVFYSDNVK